MFCAGFREHEGAICEIERPEHIFAGEFCIDSAPVQATSDHQMQHEPQIAVESESDALADAPQLAHRAAVGVRQRRGRGAEQERRAEADAFEALADNPRIERDNVRRDVGEFRHDSGYSLRSVASIAPRGSSVGRKTADGLSMPSGSRSIRSKYLLGNER